LGIPQRRDFRKDTSTSKVFKKNGGEKRALLNHEEFEGNTPPAGAEKRNLAEGKQTIWESRAPQEGEVPRHCGPSPHVSRKSSIEEKEEPGRTAKYNSNQMREGRNN